MVFKKPYAFFIKYFRLINLLLSVILFYLGYRLNILRNVINDIYIGKVTNYSTLRADYIGFRMYFLVFLIIIILSIIILLLNRKKKPLYDYLYNVIYIVFLFVYLMSVSNLFLTLDEIIVEQTSLKLYTDISFLIILPLFYFIFKYILIVIGFNLKKFDFTKDIIELKQEEKDNEEVEVIFDKNTYKYKRGIRKWLRELRYYFLENKFLISLILGIVVLIIFISIFSVNMFNSNKINVGSNFNAGNFNYKVNSIYETKYDLNNSIVKDGSKYVVVNFDVRNYLTESNSIDFRRIRLVYGKEYSYANNYFNKYFYDLGAPYNNDIIKFGQSYNFIFIFKVPSTYKSNKYVLKFYDRIVYENDESKGSYKEINVNAKNIDKKRDIKNMNLSENTIFNKKRYGNSNLTISNYDIKSNYIYNNDGKTNIIRDKDINKILLILDYKLELDEKYDISNYFKNDKDFFDKFITITYTYNENAKEYKNIKAVGCIDGKVMLSVPFEVQSATSLSLNIEFRDIKVVYKLK